MLKVLTAVALLVTSACNVSLKSEKPESSAETSESANIVCTISRLINDGQTAETASVILKNGVANVEIPGYSYSLDVETTDSGTLQVSLFKAKDEGQGEGNILAAGAEGKIHSKAKDDFIEVIEYDSVANILIRGVCRMSE